MERILYNNDYMDFLIATNDIVFDCGFADPPDNLGLSYDGYDDCLPPDKYIDWLSNLIRHCTPRFEVFWLSIYHTHLRDVMPLIPKQYNVRMYVWRFKFGQYRETDTPNGYRPILRISHSGWKPIMEERIPSVREQINDLRATGIGRVPDDVWEYGRVQGNNDERRSWHPTQHPQMIYSRIARMSVPKGGTFVDLFAGTGTAFRSVFDRNVIGVEQSPMYCELIAKEHGLSVRKI